MSLTSQSLLLADASFVDRCLMAAVQSAVNVANESVSTGTEDYHAKRFALALSILSNPPLNTQRVVYAVAQNVAVTSDSSDGDIQFTINSVWDALAGIPVNERIS